MNSKEIIAQRVAQELKANTIVNLGIGLPTLVANYLSDDAGVTLQSENGFLGLGPDPTEDQIDWDLTNAGASPATINKGGMFFDSAFSFEIIRGGHVDTTVLGALQVDASGNLANWTIPGKLVPGMGGAMDLVTGAKNVIVAMLHTSKGSHKILEVCTLPLTGANVVSKIITELCVIEVQDKGLVVTEILGDYTQESIQEQTGAKLIFAV